VEIVDFAYVPLCTSSARMVDVRALQCGAELLSCCLCTTNYGDLAYLIYLI